MGRGRGETGSRPPTILHSTVFFTYYPYYLRGLTQHTFTCVKMCVEAHCRSRFQRHPLLSRFASHCSAPVVASSGSPPVKMAWGRPWQVQHYLYVKCNVIGTSVFRLTTVEAFHDISTARLHHHGQNLSLSLSTGILASLRTLVTFFQLL